MQVASTDRGADSATTGSNATLTTKPTPQIETVVTAKPKPNELRENQSAKNEAPRVESQQTAAAQPKPEPQQEANAASPLASHNTKSALPIVPGESFISRWGGLQ
jgi:hypothetical protein